MIDKMCKKYGIELVETGVGFKYIAAEMIKGNVILGAEESGGIGFPGHVPERDGILAGLMLLELLAVEKASVNKLLARLEKEFGPHRYARIDTHFPLEKRAALMEFCKNNPPAKLLKSPVVNVKSYDGVKFVAEDGSWLMLRGSGTEPIPAHLRGVEQRPCCASAFEARNAAYEAGLKYLDVPWSLDIASALRLNFRK
jgi:phosphomannomutase